MSLTVEDLTKIKIIVDGRVDALQTRVNEIAGNQLVRDRAQMEALRTQVGALKAAIDALPEGASKAEIKGLLENIDATIVLTVNEPKPAAVPPTGGQP